MPRSSGSRCASADAGPASASQAIGSSAAVRQARANGFEQAIDGKLTGFAGAPVAVFELARGKAAVTDDHAVRDAQQLRVRELHSGPRFAVVVEHVDAGIAQLRVQRIGRIAHGFGAIVVEGD
jgi:hypothetical protein